MNALRSIRVRLLVFAFLVTLAALALSAAGLVALFGRHIERRIAEELDVYISQIAAGLETDAAGKLGATAEPAHPRFEQAYGGLYWQVADERSGALLRSRSLWDFDLKLPELTATGSESHSAYVPGPAGQDLFVREKRLVLVQRGAEIPVRISVAETLEDARTLQAGFARDLVPGLAVLGLVLLAGAWLQVGAGLRPFAAVRRGVRDIRTGRQRRLGSDVPAEIEPLVSEVNTLLDAQDQSILRARDRAADLAHGLRTPLTALASDAARLRDAGQNEIAGEIEAVAARMRRTIERELARSRARRATGQEAVALAPTANAIARTLARTPAAENIAIDVDLDEDLRALIDPDDLYDVLGNLMENAVRAARGKVRVTAENIGGSAVVAIEDDGGPVAPEDVAALAARGKRQDEAGGAGLGLAIVSDVLAACDTAPEFYAAKLGGLGVRFTLPAA